MLDKPKEFIYFLDWEIQHKRFSQFLENEKIVKSSPMNIKPKGYVSTYSSYPNDDDEEEVLSLPL